MELLTRSTAAVSKEATTAGPAMCRGRRRAIARPVASRIALLLWLSALPHLGDLHAQREDSSVEYHVKAAFLLNFTKFVEWRESAFSSPSSPIMICVLGQDPFGAILDRTVEGEKVNAHMIRTRRLLQDGDPRTCNILFISQSERERSDQIITRLRGSSVLTVSELPGFAERGGMIEFLIDAGKVRFHINAATAEAAGLKLSSRLLRVAKEVKGSLRSQR